MAVSNRAERPVAFRIDVVSDVVCPWCYIGKRGLDAALARLAAEEPGFAVTVDWHPFQLSPDVPPGGVDRARYMEVKLGGAARVKEAHDRVREIGEAAGIAFDFARIRVQPNTLAAHRLVSHVQHDRDAGDLVERLFAAFFVEGRDVGDKTVLANIAEEAGFDRAAAAAFLEGDEGAAAIAGMERHARELGVQGVPFFVFDGRLAVSGALDGDGMLRLIRKARDTPLESVDDA
jgi:predicted DsbA family dithiol-disulfide isomerase